MRTKTQLKAKTQKQLLVAFSSSHARKKLYFRDQEAQTLLHCNFGPIWRHWFFRF